MKKSRFTESQIVAVLKAGESGIPVIELCRKHGVSNATYYQWKRQVLRRTGVRATAIT
jgi:putative transposase